LPPRKDHTMSNKLYSVTVAVTKSYDVLVEARTPGTAKALASAMTQDTIKRIGIERTHGCVTALCAHKVGGNT